MRGVLFIRCCVCQAVAGLLLWSVAASGWAGPAGKTYTVRRGDTLTGIARTFGLPPMYLAAHNGLRNAGLIYVGQRLRIPAGTNTATFGSPTPTDRALPFEVQQAIDQADLKPGRWKHIVIHHSGVDTGTVRGMDRYHRDVRHMENGLAYHFVIGNGNGMGDGEIGVGSRWTRQLDGGHLARTSQNKTCLGICLVGNFETHRPSTRQLARLRALVLALMARCPLPPDAVTTHRRIHPGHTLCPGRHFPTQELLESLRCSNRDTPPRKP